MFLTTQHPSLLTNPYHDDSTMQQLYAIARHVFHDQVTKHQRICDDILDLCRDTKTTFEEVLSLLRQAWRSKSESPPRIPFKLGARFADLISETQWASFWKAAIPHEARTPWWRLLHDKIPYRIQLHRRQPDKFVNALCAICKNTLEDDFHMLVGCHLKWHVWQKALREFSFSYHSSFEARRTVLPNA